MPPEIYPSQKNNLSPLIGKTYEKFPSGLVRADQTFVCTIDQVQGMRSVLCRGAILPKVYSTNPFKLRQEYLNAEPDFFIFPDAKESYDIPGFCKFMVSGYRHDLSSEPFFTFNSQIVDISKSYTISRVEVVGEPPVVYTWVIFERYQVDSVTRHSVSDSGVTNIAVGNYFQLKKSLLTRRLTGNRPNDSDQTTIDINWTPTIVSVTRRNFGRFDEYDATETLVPYY